ncbi:DUF397 domain-containing protein [Catenuloplanes indicus]|uniref:DUF397 domain-containing protein n=1 Tax=Catenuloplanes indicus TaxID=137267 RepID=A0AAE3W355_9ACTN|nr:DUF397 domain-containing protein [Catenuloplanes indicus]MDQ0367844.1 hypothetical protein [Catenuloplanes indicus]
MDHLTWKKSTRSGPNGGDCIEVATANEHIYVRDSKNPDAAVLTVGPHAWTRFIREIQCVKGLW